METPNKNQSWTRNFERIYLSDRLPIYIISIGIFIRLYQYLCNKSLWLDEAALSLNIINRSFSGLLQHLDYNQYAPLGFLFIEKSITILLGTSEYSLRLFPLISGALSIPIFFLLAKKILKKEATPIALVLFILPWSLIYYSVEVKQYASDIMITLLFYLVLLYADKRDFNLKGSALFAIFGGVAGWFSHPVVFVMAGVGATLLFFSISKREWKKLFTFIPIFSTWLLCFAMNYFSTLNIESGLEKEWIFNYWSEHFAPFPITSIADIKWYFEHLLMIFKSKLLLGMAPVAGIWLIFFLGGLVSLFVRNKKIFFFLITPLFVTLIASALQLYPFYDRLILFLIPLVILTISEGVFELIAWSNNRSSPLSILMVFTIGILILVPILNNGNYFLKPMVREEIKPVLAYISEHREPGDTIYIHYGAKYQYLYYADRYDLRSMPATADRLKSKNPHVYSFEIDEIKGQKRVWVLFSHTYNEEKIEEMNGKYLHRLDSAGRRIDSFYSTASSVFLYDLGGGE